MRSLFAAFGLLLDTVWGMLVVLLCLLPAVLLGLSMLLFHNDPTAATVVKAVGCVALGALVWVFIPERKNTKGNIK